MNKIELSVVCLLFTAVGSIYAQDANESFNPLRTAVPSLTIAPDARGGAMGDIGAATEPDVFSQYWNPAKYVFASSKAGVSMSYTPWLSKLVNDIDLVYAAGYYKFGGYDNLAIGASIRYFSLGNIVLNDYNNNTLGDASPYEMAADISISMRASETFSLAVAGRYIRSDLGAGLDEELYPGNTVAADIAGFYSKYLNIGRGEYLLGLGFNISNIGPKISYDDGNTFTFLPTTLRLGASFQIPLDDYNSLAINTDISKYLVPTPPFRDDMDGNEKSEAQRKYEETSSIAGIFSSFGDAPGGMSEELKEVMWALGAEYAYDKKFFVRAGYFHESKTKGNRQYYTVGGGFKLSAFQMDVAYLISSVPSNPLDQTLRFSLSFDIDGMKGLMR
ncbi:hypothetical protein SAMD00024442_33_10 [Candidatus Symbiothrix dinenymphae]|nr:hypothetical protein SAMD00024442_33_10 [Candidatus Symbiothrix dinenymphae]